MTWIYACSNCNSSLVLDKNIIKVLLLIGLNVTWALSLLYLNSIERFFREGKWFGYVLFIAFSILFWLVIEILLWSQLIYPVTALLFSHLAIIGLLFLKKKLCPTVDY